MKSSNQDKAEGKFHKMKGKVNEVARKLSDNPKSETKGIESVVFPAGIIMEHSPSPLWFDDFN